MNRSRLCVFLFLLLLVFHAGLLLHWIKKDNAVPGVDDSIHLSHSLVCHYLSQDLTPHNMRRLLAVSPYYPPFFPCSSTVFYRILDASYASARISNALFLFLLLVAAFFLAAKLFSVSTAFTSALLLSFYPMTLHLSRFYFLDLSLCFFVTLALYCLAQTRHFTRLPQSIVFGVVCGFGMLTKWTFAFFLAVPALYALYTGWRGAGTRNKRCLSLFLFSVLSCLILCAPWYVVNFESLTRTLKQGYYLDMQHDPSPRQALFYTFYLKAWVEQIQFYHAAVSIAALAFLLGARKLKFPEKLLFAHIVSSLVIFTVIHNKDVRFTAPLLPALAVLSARGLSQMTFRGKDAALFLILPVVCLMTFSRFSPKPVRENWKLAELSLFLTQSVRDPSKPVLTGIYAGGGKVHLYSLQYFLLRAYFEKRRAFPFVLRERSRPEPEGDALFLLKAQKESHFPGMKMKKKFSLPDGETLFVYFAEQKE